MHQQQALESNTTGRHAICQALLAAVSITAAAATEWANRVSARKQGRKDTTRR
jgi:hypothetical protein